MQSRYLKHWGQSTWVAIMSLPLPGCVACRRLAFSLLQSLHPRVYAPVVIRIITTPRHASHRFDIIMEYLIFYMYYYNYCNYLELHPGQIFQYKLRFSVIKQVTSDHLKIFKYLQTTNYYYTLSITSTFTFSLPHPHSVSVLIPNQEKQFIPVFRTEM